MKFRNQAIRFGAVLVGSVAALPVFAADESGITTTSLEAVITDGKAKAMVLALAMLAFIVAIKIVKKVRGSV